MEKSGFVVGIDLGTSKIVGLMGRKNEQGVISVLASESIPSDNCVRYGIVYNIDDTAGKIKRIIHLLENKSGRKIGKIYVSIAGKSLRAMEYTLSKVLGEDTEITFAIIDQMELQARQNKPEFLTNYSVVAPQIFLDGKYEEDPIGRTASDIEARYRLIVGRPNLKNSLVKSITEKNQIEIAGFIVGPLAAGAIVLDEEDKQAGCALIDFGAGTTTLSVYKGGLLHYMVVIPFGGRTITKDIKELGFTDEAAETYKIKYGRVGKDKNKLSTPNSEIDVKELNKVIQLRQEEIILNALNQIKESGYAGQLPGGIIIIGGASQLNGLSDLLSEKSQMKVKKGAAKRLYINNVSDLLLNPIYTQCLGLLLFANENCEKKEAPAATYNHYERPRQENVPRYENSHPHSENAYPKAQEYGLGQEEPEEPASQEYEKTRDKYIEPIKEIRERPSKHGRKSSGIMDLFGKIQNLGGTMFKDED